MKRSQAFPSTFLGKDDVPRPILATVQVVKMEAIKGEHGEEAKPVAYWVGSMKPMILNNTNWLALEELYGDDSDFWVHKQIEIYFEPNVMFGQKRVGGLRLRKPIESASPASSGIVQWQLDEAVREAAQVGITRDEIRDKVKTMGFAGWSPARDTSWLRAAIASKRAALNPDADLVPSVNGEEIPF